jgi:hypothetical protein
MEELKYIGPYLSYRFYTESYWMGDFVPIYNLQDLLNFVKTKRITVNVRQNLKEWLRNICKNERSQECDGEYRIRYENEKGWNAIIEFLRENLDGYRIKGYLPAKKRRRTVSSRC